MPWSETCALGERARFVVAVEAGEEPMAAICRRFGISRQQGYKWFARWRAEGPDGLADRSRAPLGHLRALAAERAEACLGVRRAHPTWGPVKVRAWLERKHPGGAPWPAASTIGALFDHEGLTVRRKLRRRAPPGGALFVAEAANDVWTIDFKGWFRTGDGTRVDPLTLADACTRYPARAARRWRAPIPSTSGRSSTPPSASSGCRGGCAPTTARPSPRWARAGSPGSR